MPRKITPRKHTPYQPQADCSHKRRFGTEALALRALEDSQLFNPHVELAIYKCPLCSGWHFTSKQASQGD